MFHTLVRRLLASALLIVGLLTLVFFVVRLAPGDPFSDLVSPDIDPGLIARMHERFGLAEPLHVQYVRWVRAFLIDFDFGLSFSRQVPVADLLAVAIPNTLRLMSLALVLRMALGVALGVMAAARRGGWVDRGITFVALTLYSMPAFWLGLMLLLVFAFQLGWLPAGQMASIDHAALPLEARFGDTLRHLLLPVLVLSVGGVAATARYMRAALLEVLSQDYVRTARAKGLAESRVVWVHALRNALLPAATLLGLSFPSLIGGALVVEYVFAWPGMGRLTVDALYARDYPIIMATTFLSAVMVVTGNLVADLLYAALDPRIRLSA